MKNELIFLNPLLLSETHKIRMAQSGFVNKQKIKLTLFLFV